MWSNSPLKMYDPTATYICKRERWGKIRVQLLQLVGAIVPLVLWTVRPACFKGKGGSSWALSDHIFNTIVNLPVAKLCADVTNITVPVLEMGKLRCLLWPVCDRVTAQLGVQSRSPQFSCLLSWSVLLLLEGNRDVCFGKDGLFFLSEPTANLSSRKALRWSRSSQYLSVPRSSSLHQGAVTRTGWTLFSALKLSFQVSTWYCVTGRGQRGQTHLPERCGSVSHCECFSLQKGLWPRDKQAVCCIHFSNLPVCDKEATFVQIVSAS